MQRLFVVFIVILHSTAHAGTAQRWSAAVGPAPGEPRIIGSYTAGCIQGALALPLEGPGFQVMRRQRRRFFGHPTLVQYVQNLGRIVATRGLGVLSIGDMGQSRGGPTPYGHRSHQNGLDVDIWFWLDRPGGTLTPAERDTLDMPSMLTYDHHALHLQRWTPQHPYLLQAAADFQVVDRIFVNPLIKQALCGVFPGAPWLRKIRPWWGHDDHFHVRLRCPAGEAECLNQAPVPEEDGCDISLAWWLQAEPQQPPKPSAPVEVQLPRACRDVLKK
jgi:penicillin-insensitive murein endopeptidase